MKKIITLTAVSLFLATILGVGAYAATLKCTVEKVEGEVVTMNCGDKAELLSADTKVKVKTVKTETTAIEGC